ncbi:aldo/keto reductase [Paenibacillus agricola]|uniref:Aldo/keto reductase n=1 Tax=Paenibacillus agricola TaxID=2716264 RepID=A0ABX0JDP2_9BACL|nr:aldo/keto reductase [Paenibacillus agricola]NHN32982.1 aldo/keto reductase [Paenibacillus agricola]
MSNQQKLGLGGHSFIEALGNDPEASFEEQCQIVAACLDNGIHVIDTTFYQERVALGRVLQELGRRDEAHIIAWNFFQHAGQTDILVSSTRYEAHHIDIMLEELSTNRIDTLVIHRHDNKERLLQEFELVRQWLASGKIKRVALGMVKGDDLLQLDASAPISCVLAPYNAFTREAEAIFIDAKARGYEVIALSPFVRGWKLDEIGEDKAKVADILLRWAVGSELVDLVIVSMRKSEWVATNLATVQRGALSDEEALQVEGWVERLGGK